MLKRIIIIGIFVFLSIISSSIIQGQYYYQEEAENIAEGICYGTLCCVSSVVYFIISLVLAYWMLKDADKRNRNGVVWFVVGLFLGFIGFIIWMIVRPKSIKQVIKVKEQDRRCPNCGRIIPLESKICPYCKKDFEEYMK